MSMVLKLLGRFSALGKHFSTPDHHQTLDILVENLNICQCNIRMPSSSLNEEIMTMERSDTLATKFISAARAETRGNSPLYGPYWLVFWQRDVSLTRKIPFTIYYKILE